MAVVFFATAINRYPEFLMCGTEGFRLLLVSGVGLIIATAVEFGADAAAVVAHRD